MTTFAKLLIASTLCSVISLEARAQSKLSCSAKHPEFPDGKSPLITSIDGKIAIDEGHSLATFDMVYTLIDTPDGGITRIFVAFDQDAAHIQARLDGEPAVSIDRSCNVYDFTWEARNHRQHHPRPLKFSYQIPVHQSTRSNHSLGLFVSRSSGNDLPMVDHLPHALGQPKPETDPAPAQKAPLYDRNAPDGRRVETDILVDMPRNWQAIAPKELVRDYVRGSRHVSCFRGTQPNKPVFLAAAFAETKAVPPSSVRVLVAPDTAENWADEILNIVQAATQEEAGRLGMALPYPSLQIAEIPGSYLPKGAVGQAFPGEVLLSGELRKASALERAWIVAHEVAHQWFDYWTGDSSIQSPSKATESLADELAVNFVRNHFSGADIVQELGGVRRDYFRACASQPEASYLVQRESTACDLAVSVAKRLTMLTFSDLVGEEAFGRKLRSLVKRFTPFGDSMMTLDECINTIEEGSSLDARKMLARGLLRGVTYQNVVSARRIDRGKLEIELIPHRFDGGAGSERHAVAGTFLLPVGVRDCSESPHILSWILAEDSKRVVLQYEYPAHLSSAGVDPWDELLDDGDHSMSPIPGECEPSR